MSDEEAGETAGENPSQGAVRDGTRNAGQGTVCDGGRTANPDRARDANVLFTGFPGFLGSALIERLLDRGDGPVACLIQSEYRDLAERRAAEIADDDDAIRLYEGDITEPDLGLGDALEEFENVTECYHLAAVYDLAVDAELADAVNVEGTRHVLDAAETLDVDRFQYVSTCYVSGRYDGVFTEEQLREGQSFNNHYERTKYEAEVLVQKRMADGLRATIYRPAIVVGDSRTGETQKYDGPYFLLRWIMSQPRWFSTSILLPGSSSAEFNVVPRNYVVDAIAHLSGLDRSAGEVYQLCDPAPLTVPKFVKALGSAAGHRTVGMPATKSIARPAMRGLSRLGASTEPAALEYLDHPTRYTCSNVRRDLAGSGIECPPFESYVDRLVAFVEENPNVGDDAMV